MFDRQIPRGLTLLAVVVSVLNSGGATPAAAVSQPSPIRQALEAYGQRPDPALARKLARERDFPAALLRYPDAVAAWADSAHDAERKRRQQTGIAFALELLATTVDGPMVNYRSAKPLIEWACSQLAQAPPSEFERAVQLASVAILQGTDDPLLGIQDGPYKRAGHLDHAAKRYPDDERFKFARVLTRHELRVIATRQLLPPDLLPGSGYNLTPEKGLKRLDETFELLAGFQDPLVADEARLRSGVLRLLTGKRAEAAQELGIASTSEQPFVAYLANLVLGTLYYRTGETNAAVARYAKAAHVLPATSARLGLAAALLRQGRLREAAEVTDAWAADARTEDPYRIYGLGLFHELPQYLAAMRSALQ
jgi:tetratricopeptide (TPR) repeat protein